MSTRAAGGSRADGLVGLTTDFQGYYRPAPETWTAAYTAGTVVLDTNALLDLYRLSPRARDELLAVLTAMRDRLFVPHQVATEFHRRRIDAVAARQGEFAQSLTELQEIHGRAKSLVRRAAHRAHGGDADAADVLTAVADAVDRVAGFLEAVSEEYDLDPDELTAAGSDPVLARLEAILKDRVGRRPAAEVLKADLAEGARRAKDGLPPGFKDAGKKDNPFGDYLWWAEALRHAVAAPKPVLLVCNDVAKGDWTYELRGFRIGPHPALVDEMRSAAGADLLLCTTSQLLSHAAAALQVEVSDSTLAETAALPDGGADASGRRHVVPEDWATKITGARPADIDAWIADGWLDPPDDGMFAWPQLRLIALIRAMLAAGRPEAEIARVASELPPRVAPYNQLVVRPDSVAWAKRHEADELRTGDDPPDFVFDTRPVERKMRIVQSQLQHSADQEAGPHGADAAPSPVEDEAPARRDDSA